MLTTKVTYRAWSDDLEDFVMQSTDLSFEGRTPEQVLRQMVALFGILNIKEVRLFRGGAHLKSFDNNELRKILGIVLTLPGCKV